MKFIILLKTSTRTLKKHKIRSFLTILGIMIGIAAIIITFSIGRGAEEAITNQILTMGENSIYVIPSSFIKHGALKGNINKFRLRLRDVASIEEQSPEIKEITPMHMTVQTIEFQGQSASQNVVGCYPNLPIIDDSEIQDGIFFNDFHQKHRSSVVVLGSTPAEKLFKNVNPINKIILIKGHPFKVIGVLKPKPHFVGPRDPNERVFIPFSTSKKVCYYPEESYDEATALAIRLYKKIDSVQFLRKLKRILRFIYKTSVDEEDKFTVFDQKTIENVARDAARIIRMFGLLAASISLIVGSIGVMNIMLVSVKERTKEIGLRMAIGATPRSIQLQFLIESVMLCFIGGLIGILIGLSGQFAIGHFTNLRPVIELAPMIISLLVTIFIGVFFGYYPAYQASQLNPVDALLDK